MPYISNEDREHLKQEFRLEPSEIANLIKSVPSGKVKGAFNYFVSRLFCRTFNTDKAGYTELSNAIAVLADMEHEMRRRLLDPYEDKAIEKTVT